MPKISPTPRILVYLALLALVTSGCSSLPTPAAPTGTATAGLQPEPTGISATQTVETEETLTPTEATSPIETISASPTPALEDLPLPHYELSVDLDYSNHTATIAERIEYINRSPDALDKLVLMAEPAYYPGVFQLNSLTWGDGTPVSDVSWDVTQMHLPLPRTLQPGESAALDLNYTLIMPTHERSQEIRPIPFGYTPRQLNLVDWYPFVAPYRSGQGWLAHKPGYFGEHLVLDEADFDVKVRLTDGRSDIILAASAPAEQEGEWTRYQHLKARNFALSASDQYQVEETQVGDIRVVSYFFPYHTYAGNEVLNVTAQSVDLYSRLYAPYRRTYLAAVEADFLDGMEYDGMYFLSEGFYNLYDGKPGGYLTAIAAHETAHQWWYALVANDQALEPWLDEALCTYSERLYYENIAPAGLDWWWNYRVNYYNPRGWVNTDIYITSGYRDYRDAVYLNGAWFLEKARLAMGDEAFFAFLQAYAARYADQIANHQDFFNLLKSFSKTDLSILIQKYFSYEN